jgi:hypothetical protein
VDWAMLAALLPAPALAFEVSPRFGQKGSREFAAARSWSFVAACVTSSRPEKNLGI